jgi:biopolymer transport protein ExbD
MQVDQPGTITAEMNVTPMIDVLLVLIIVAILVLTLEAKFLVNVPADDTRSFASAQPAIVLELGATGGYAINGQRVPEVGLEARLKAIFVRRPGQVLFVRASGERPYQEVVHAIDVARAAGVGVIGYMP